MGPYICQVPVGKLGDQSSHSFLKNEFQNLVFTYQVKNQVTRFPSSLYALVLFKEIPQIFALAQFLNFQPSWN